MYSLSVFPGSEPDDPVYQIDLRCADMRARVISWGAVLNNLSLPVNGAMRSVVLGFGRADHYRDHGRNHGGTVGRYGGRIRDGRLPLDGAVHQLTRNLDGQHHLHGGNVGLGRRNWQIVDVTPVSVTLQIVSPDGDEGYPGELLARCRYEVTGDALIVDLCAEVTAPSPVNLLHHSYFNLDSTSSIAGHLLQIEAAEMLEFDRAGLPTGRILPVSESRFDFRTARQIGLNAGYDSSFVLPGGLQDRPRLAATLTSGRGDLGMQVMTTEPGLHFYSGFAAAASVPLQDGRACVAESGLCLEATRFNDAVNFPSLGDVIARPDRPYFQRTVFRFFN